MTLISVVPGDGIGPEVTHEAVQTLQALDLGLSFQVFDQVNADAWLRTGVALPEADFDRMKDSAAILFGAIGDPRITTTEYARSVLLRLRFGLDLYVNHRPAKLLHPQLSPLRDGAQRDIDCVIVRENTEGLYAGIGGRLRPGTAEEIATDAEVSTYHGVSRVLRYAFGIARRGVCMVDKSNAVRFGGQLWQRCWAEARTEHPGVNTAHLYVDNAAMQLVSDPAQFDVLVTNNSYGDILSDIAAQVAGGLGTAASANLNPERHIGLFEPVHGSAPDIAGKGIANPVGAILSAALLADFIGRPDAGAAIRDAVASAVADGACTPDLGGALSTAEAGAAVRARLSGRAVPLTRTQRQLWLGEQLGAHPAGYLVPLLLRLDGPLDIATLETALTAVLARHDVLRTGVRNTPAGPVGVLHPPEPVRLAPEPFPADLRAEPMDLSAGPPLRARLFHRAEDSHVLCVTVHHLAFDDWSRQVFYRDLQDLFNTGLPSTPRPPQYREIAQRITDRVSEQTLGTQLAYWRERLAGATPFELAPHRPRPPRRAGVGRSTTSTVSSDVTARLEKLARGRGATLAAALFAACLVVLRQYSGRDDITVGSTVALRDEPGAEATIGPLLTTVVLHGDTSGDPGFDELVDRTAEVVLSALEHSDVPFDLLVNELAPERDLSRTPLFQIQLGYGSGRRHAPALDGLAVTELPVPWETSKYDVSFWFDHYDDGSLGCDVAWDAALYHDETMRRMADHLGAVIEHVAAHPGTRIGDIPLSGADARRMREHGTGPDISYPGLCLHEAFEAQAHRTPHATAVIDADGNRISYTQLNARANRLAHTLLGLGAGPESFVAIRAAHSVELFAALFGILKAGAAYVPLDAEHPAERIDFVLADTGAQILVTDGPPPAGFTGHVVRLGTGLDAPSTDPAPAVTADNLVYAMYTSGSTGRPKGVLITHRGLMNYLWWAVDGYGLDGAEGAPMLGSIAYDLSVPNFFLPLIQGRSVTLLRHRGRGRELEALAGLLAADGDFSLLKITPGHVDVLRDLLPPGSVQSVRTTVIGADEVRPDTVLGWQAVAPHTRVIAEYGPTETVVGCSVHPASGDLDTTTLVSIGRPIANMRMYVLDAELRQVPWGAVGELYIGGAGVARGYLNRPGLTAQRFLPDPYSAQPGARIYRSGDLARLGPDGDVEFLGRTDHQVKIRGYRVELSEVEVALRACPGVADSVVLAWQAGPGDRRLVAYVARQPGAEPAPERVREFVAGRLPAHAVPARLIVLDALPRLGNGKLDRKALPAPGRDDEQVTEPRTGTEKALLTIWSEVLDAPRLGVHDDFFRQGGHSLLVLRAANRMRELTDADIPFSLIFDHPTVAAAAAWIDRGGDNG